ncbi:MAG: Cof-type HAD-IIB family hydrolase [Acidimicrobiales bacterium]|jgi:Cof subfamily protein (haloacid dehalogenase superfamily)
MPPGGRPQGPTPDNPIKLFLADVDGTLVTPDKELTQKAIEAVHALRDADVLFAITSGRPPRGMAMLVEPLGLTTPIAAFNGGLIVEPDMTVMEQKLVPEPLVGPILSLLESHGLVTWIYRGADWYVRDPKGPHVDREAATVQFQPTVVDSYGVLTDQVAKIVGVSDDHDAMARATEAARDQFSDDVTAAQSQPYYLDVTHPEANKGGVVKFLSSYFGIAPSQIASIGDMPNDVLMFAHSGLSIAMGNASSEVQRSARMVTTSDEDEGFANAVRRFILKTPSTVRNPIQKEE